MKTKAKILAQRVTDEIVACLERLGSARIACIEDVVDSFVELLEDYLTNDEIERLLEEFEEKMAGSD